MNNPSEKQAFKQWIRSGQFPLPEGQLAPETKFNPYHDTRGRFTFAPGTAGLGMVPQLPAPLRRTNTRRVGPGHPAGQNTDARGVRPVRGYLQEGANVWRAANDRIFQQAAAEFNQRNGLKPGDSRYVDGQFLKVWAMVESGGSKAAFLSDPFQVNNVGDWDKAKKALGLKLRQAPGPALSAQAALIWLDMKAHKTAVLPDGTKRVQYLGMRRALERYNANKNLDHNGVSHDKNYPNMIFNLLKY